MIGAVVLNYNSAEDTIEAVSNLLQDVTLVCVVVVDNASPDGSASLLSESLAKLDAGGRDRVRFLPLNRNDGYSAGNNAGLRLLEREGCRRALVVNPDVRLEPNCVGELDQAIDETTKVVSPVLLRPSVPPVVDTFGGAWEYRWGRGRLVNAGAMAFDARQVFPVSQRAALMTFSGACFLADLVALRRAGYLPEYLFLYGEEADLTMRLRAGGLRIGVIPQAHAWHIRGSSVGSANSWRERSPVALRSAAESAVLLSRVWWPRWLLLVVACRLIMAVILIPTRGLGAASAVIQGVVHGMTRRLRDDLSKPVLRR